ncbi:zinc finger and BTB domain-containing protein 21 [Vanacampus margaritifer]
MESLVHYSYPAHALSVLGLLNEQRLRGHMCDVVLAVADQRYQAHKSVLAASSEYFQSLFTRMDDTSLKVVNLDFCEPDAFEIVLNYIYSSSLLVDKDSLSAIQELGYTLGIPFLTNIVSTRPHASYCVSRKRLSYTEGEDNDVHTRSVIVCRVRNDISEPSCPNYQRKTPERSSSLDTTDLAHPPSEPSSCVSVRNSESITHKSPEQSEATGRRSTHAYASILKGNPSYMSAIRPQLKTSASFSEAEVQHIRMPSCSDQDMKQESEEQEPHYSTKVSFQGQASELSQTIDRSGPLIKSLLRRSLSMDSPVPVFSPTLELKELQNHEQSVVKLASKTSDPEISAHNGNSRTSPIILKSKYHSRSDEQTRVEREHSVKVEPSSPLADPMDIIRITVQEALPVNLKDLQANYEQCSKASLIPFGKRKERPDNRRYPFKKTKILKDHAVSPEENTSEVVSRSTSEDNEINDESLLNKIFTCWNCFKVFRSNAGLHRHVNMYHNPEKPYACDICHKRFHTNFKVWTHCQTQHGVLQNPASSSSSPVMDDRFQKKLIDMVREREIKKALLWKLKRNKQALQSSTLSKKRSRSNFVCPYCGKAFVFQSQYRQHLRTHPAEKADKDAAAGENILYQEQDGVIHQKNSDTGVYACRLCNMKLPSLVEQGDHERGCRHSTVCPYCGLRFSSPTVKKDHEVHCKYKKLTCLECMRTFKSSFSIWRHQVEVHNNNMINIKEHMNLKQEEHNERMSEMFIEEHYTGEPLARERNIYNDSSGTPMYDSEDSSSYVPEDLSMGHHGKLVVKEEPLEESVSEREETESSQTGLEEAGVWPCEKCGSLFCSRKDLERHQELLCHIKPFICHICNKAFRTNFRLWSHYQTHMSSSSEHGAKEMDGQPPPLSPSPPMTSQNSERPSSQASVLNQSAPVAVAVADESSSPETSMSLVNNTKSRAQLEKQPSNHSPVSRSNSVENSGGPQESETLFYHASSLSALTFKRQYMCKLCHRTFKTAFSLWSHEQSHGHVCFKRARYGGVTHVT